MYLDEEFDNNFTLRDTSELKDTGTIKIVRSNSTSNPTADSPDEAIHDEHDHVESEDQAKENQPEDQYVETIAEVMNQTLAKDATNGGGTIPSMAKPISHSQVSFESWTSAKEGKWRIQLILNLSSKLLISKAILLLGSSVLTALGLIYM